MLPLCRSENIAVTPWSPLARGFLADDGSMSSQRARTDTVSVDLLAIGVEAQDHAIAERVREVARSLKVTPAKVALSWLLGLDGVTALVVGADSVEQVDEAADALSLALTPEQRRHLEEKYRPRAILGHD